MQSLQTHEAGTGDTKVNVPDCLTSDATATLAFTYDQLDKVGALLVQLVLASILVDLVNFVVAAAQFGKSLETHLEAIFASCAAAAKGM